MKREEIRAPEELPEIERIPEVPGWQNEAPRDFSEVRKGQGCNAPSVEDHPLGQGVMLRRFSSIQEALRYARKIAPGTVMGPSPGDEESED